MDKHTGRERFHQSNKEALICIGLTIFYFIWWYGFAYGLGNKPVDSYKYVLGFPSWFFYSCILGFFIFSFLTWFVVTKFFKDIPLDEDDNK